jgi:cyclopropane-fatty-acyl-phospholipid synthase
MAKLSPFYKDVQAHYDLSDEFFELFLDPTKTYSCAYFRDEQMSLEEAQIAKIDLSLGKCKLSPGQLLLDIGCGWGTTAIRAAQLNQVNAIGLTLSQNQHVAASRRVAEMPVVKDRVEFRLLGWEEFDQPVDRIVSIGAFEHFRHERHAAFFERCRQLLPVDGRMMLHTIVLSSMERLRELGIVVTEEHVAFAKFIRREIFPGGQLCEIARIRDYAEKAGFAVEHEQSLRLHYARTLDAWAQNLSAAKEQAIRITSQEVYDRYMKYLCGCAKWFRSGEIDVVQFQLACV